MKKCMFLSILTVLLMVAVFIGCDSDSSSTGNGNTVIGDTNSENFQFVEDNVGEDAFDNIGLSLELSFGFIEEIPGSQATAKKFDHNNAASDSLVVSDYVYSYSEGWHIFSFSAVVYDDYQTAVTGIDSIQTLVDDSPVQVPDSTMNGLKIRHHFTFVNDEVEGSGDHAYDIDATNYEIDSTGVIAGSGTEQFSAYFQDTASVCSLSVSNSITINDVVLYLDDMDDSCPQSGSVALSASLDLSCSNTLGTGSLDIDGNWSITATFNGDVETFTFTDQTTTWVVVDTCGSNSGSTQSSGSANYSDVFKGISFK